MTKEEVRRKLAAHKEELQGLHVARLSLFGSVLHGSADEGSDVDLLVSFSCPVGLLHFIKLRHRLQEILGIEKVDLVSHNAVHPLLKKEVLEEACDVA